MTTNGTPLPLELLGDDAADAAVAADDEMIADRLEHTFVPAALQPLGQAAFDDDRGEQREGVERRADAAEQQHDREGLAGPRQVVDFLVAHRRHRDDGHVERIPRRPAFDRACSRPCRRR